MEKLFTIFISGQPLSDNLKILDANKKLAEYGIKKAKLDELKIAQGKIFRYRESIIPKTITVTRVS